jgi:hypothetical protein
MPHGARRRSPGLPVNHRHRHLYDAGAGEVEGSGGSGRLGADAGHRPAIYLKLHTIEPFGCARRPRRRDIFGRSPQKLLDRQRQAFADISPARMRPNRSKPNASADRRVEPTVSPIGLSTRDQNVYRTHRNR